MAERSQINWVNLALAAGGAYLFIRYVMPLFSAVGSGVSAVAQGASTALTSAQSGTADILTKLFPSATAAPAFSAGGTNIVMPDGSSVPVTSVEAATLFTAVDNSIRIQFFYQGRNYQTISAQPDSSGNYYVQ